MCLNQGPPRRFMVSEAGEMLEALPLSPNKETALGFFFTLRIWYINIWWMSPSGLASMETKGNFQTEKQQC